MTVASARPTPAPDLLVRCRSVTRRRAAVLITCFGVGACAGGNSSSTAPATPISAQLRFTAQPSATSGGQVLAPVQVAIQDASGHTVVTASDIVTLALGTNQNGATLSGTTAIAAVNGVATFSTLSIDKVGSAYTFIASATNLLATTSAAFAVTVGPPAKLTFTVQPSNAVAGQALAPVVQVAIGDAGGNTVPTASNAITLSIGVNPTGAALSGTLTTNAVSGLANFSKLVLNKTGSGYTLAATAAALTPATSTAFAISSGAGAQLVYTEQPSTVPADWVMTPPVQVTVQDAEGNVATGFIGNVVVGFGTNPTGGTLLGTLTAPVVGGVATFSTLRVNDVGNGYTLQASVGRFAVTSTPFIVGTTGISYFGGPVIHTPKVAAIYWSRSVIYTGGPPPGTFGFPAADHSLIAFFLRHLGGSPFFNIVTTYFDTANVQNVVTYTQYWADSTGPASAAPTDAEIQAEIMTGFSTGALTYDPNTMYAVFTSSGINLGGHFVPTPGGYCAYHESFTDAIGRIVNYAVMPYEQDYNPATASYICSEWTSVSPNNDPAADAEVNTLTHELAETITDDNQTAWYVNVGPNAGDEIGDLCNFNFGSVYQTPNGTSANQPLGGRNFFIQMLWVNAETSLGAPIGCQNTWTSTTVASSSKRPLHVSHVVLASRPVAPAGPHIMRMKRAGS
jgi:hypothetical protein